MSSILKALRKLEDEKSDLGEGSVDLARDILKRSYEEHRSRPIWWLVALLTAVLLLVAGWRLFFPSEDARQQKVLVVQPTEQTIQAVPVIDNAPPQQLQPVVVMPSRPAETAKKHTTTSVEQNPSVAAEEQPGPPIAAVVTSIVIPDLIIEEIVFVADPSARLAVINDLPVMQGTDIEGARVVEILSDRVRFEFQGVRFDKFMNQNN
jgi:general secretion pathway protein B